MKKILKKLHLWGLHKRACCFFVNKVFVGTKHFKVKRRLLNASGHQVGKNSKVVGPVLCTGTVIVGENCWIGRDFTVHGNGRVIIGDNCDIAPEVAFLTGGHVIGTSERRAGQGEEYSISVGNGCWIGARTTVLGNTNIGHGCVVAACACVTSDVPDNTLTGGVPAKTIRRLDIE